MRVGTTVQPGLIAEALQRAPGVGIERGAGSDIVRDVGDGDDDDVPAAIGRVGIWPRPYRVVVIARVLGVDGEDGLLAKVKAPCDLLIGDGVGDRGSR